MKTPIFQHKEIQKPCGLSLPNVKVVIRYRFNPLCKLSRQSPPGLLLMSVDRQQNVHMWHLNRSAGTTGDVEPFLFSKPGSAANNVHKNSNKGKPKQNVRTFVSLQNRASMDVTNHMKSPNVSCCDH